MAVEQRVEGAMGKIRFLHIPKTAGSSFTQCLKRIYGRGRNFFGFTGKINEDLQRYAGLTSKSDIRLFAGHAFRTVGIKEIDRLPTITILREPISRVKSFCQHVHEGKSPHLLRDFPPEGFYLEDFLSSGNEELDNLQVRILTGYRGEITRQNGPQWVAKALEVLKNDITCYGIMENFDFSLMLFRLIFNWPWPTYRIKNRKRRSKRIDFKDEHLERIKELNFADIELYNVASGIFYEKINENEEKIHSGLTEFERHQRVFQMYSWIYGIAGRIRRKLDAPERSTAALRTGGRDFT
jgi:hypothetical protein